MSSMSKNFPGGDMPPDPPGKVRTTQILAPLALARIRRSIKSPASLSLQLGIYAEWEQIFDVNPRGWVGDGYGKN